MKKTKKKKIKEGVKIHYWLYVIMSLMIILSVNASAEIVRVVSRADGGVSIIYPVKNCDFNKTQKELGFEGRPYKDIDKSLIPADRKYRNAWKLDKDKIAIDAIKQAEIDSKVAEKTLYERIVAIEQKVNTLEAVK